MGTRAALVIHPEPWGATGSGMRWALPEVDLPVGRLQSAPGALGELIDSGVLVTAWCEPHALLLELATGLNWREHGPSVRTGICDAVGDLDAWRCDDDRNAVLRLIADDVLAGQVGDYIRSHGGEVQIVSARDDCLTVGFEGTCGHCPASGVTLNQRLAAAVRERYPSLTSVTERKRAETRSQVWLWPRRRDK